MIDEKPRKDKYIISFSTKTNRWNIKNKINAIENYIKISNENFKFDIFDVKDDNYLAYNTYSEKNKSEYGWHSDLNKDNNNHFKLTVLLNISTVNYVGGFF